MKRIIILTLNLLVLFSLRAQESNLQTFTPSALFGSGEYEVNLFNSLYSQNEERNRDGRESSLGQSQGFLNSQIQYTFGSKKFPKINFGLEANITTGRYGAEDDNSPLDFFNGDASYKETVLASFGPRVKFNISKKIPRLSIQSTFLFPVSKKLEDPRFINHDRYTWFTQLFFDQDLGQNFQLFLEGDFLYRINRNSTNKRNFFRTPLSGFLSYFPTSKSTLFIFTQYSPRYEVVENSVEKEFGLSQWFTQVGLGAKYQLTSSLAVELSYGDFVSGRLTGSGYNVNFGLRYIRR